MPIQSQFEQLVAEMRAQFPDARVELESLPSGFQDLNFFWLERLWVFVYAPSPAEFGVDEVGENKDSVWVTTTFFKLLRPENRSYWIWFRLKATKAQPWRSRNEKAR